jgi:hypothetical protein
MRIRKEEGLGGNPKGPQGPRADTLLPLVWGSIIS